MTLNGIASGIYPLNRPALRARLRQLSSNLTEVERHMQSLAAQSRDIASVQVYLAVTSRGQSSQGPRIRLRWKSVDNQWVSDDNLYAYHSSLSVHLQQWLTRLHEETCALNTLYALMQSELRELQQLTRKLVLTPNPQEQQPCPIES